MWNFKESLVLFLSYFVAPCSPKITVEYLTKEFCFGEEIIQIQNAQKTESTRMDFAQQAMGNLEDGIISTNPICVFLWIKVFPQLMLNQWMNKVYAVKNSAICANISVEMESHLVRKPKIFFMQEVSDVVEIQRIFNATRFLIDTNIYVVTSSNIWEVYHIKTRQVIRKLGDPFNDLYQSVIARRGNFLGETIGVTIRTKQPDWMRFEGSGKYDNISLTGGFSVNLYWDFQAILNFTTRAMIGDGLTTLPNKTLGGKTVEQLYGDLADLSLSQSSVVPFRAKQLTFLQPTYYGIINCFFKQPSANSIRNIVTAPFAHEVWLSLIATWLFLIALVKIGLIMKMRFTPSISPCVKDIPIPHFPRHFTFDSDEIDSIDKFHTRWWQYSDSKPSSVATTATSGNKTDGEFDEEEENDDADFLYASEVGMWTFAANCQKSWHRIPSSFGLRMMFLVGMLCGVVSYVGYSGAIVSTLTVAIVPVKQFSDLVNFKFKFTVHEWSEPFQNFLQLMIDKERLDQKVLKITTAEEISHLLDGKRHRAFLTYSDLFYPTALELNYTELFICKQISQVQVSSVFYKSAMFLKKGGQFTEFFNHKIMILKERGLNIRYLKTYERSNIPLCGGDGDSSFDPVEFSDILTAFLVSISGIISGLSILLFECTFYKCKKKFKKFKKTS